MTTATMPTTVKLPNELWIVVAQHHYPAPVGDMVAPFMIPFDGLGFGMPVFGDKKLAEKFVCDPKFDLPCALKQIAWEHVIRVGENPIAIIREHGDEDEYFFMFDPRPWGEWQGVEDMGTMVAMDEAAKALREELAE